MLRAALMTTAVATVLTAMAFAQSRDRGNQRPGRSSDASCSDGWNDRRASWCEIREATIPGLNPLEINGGSNGGIHIRGWDRTDVLVRSKIMAHADTDADARRIVAGVRIDTAGGRVRADGPDTSRDESWSVSFDVQVPRTAMLTLTGDGEPEPVDGEVVSPSYFRVLGVRPTLVTDAPSPDAPCAS